MRHWLAMVYGCVCKANHSSQHILKQELNTVFTRLNMFADKNISGARGGTSAKYIYWKRLPLEHRTSNVRLPLELRSDRPQTLGKRVSDDLQLSIFRRQKKKNRRNFSVSERCFSSFSVNFGGARWLLTSKSDSLTNFAPGTQLLRSVRLLELSFVVRSFKKLGKF